MIEVGQKFGKYALVERLAVGGMAEIFKAVAPGTDGKQRIVAIKRLHRSICDDADLTQMLIDEARISVLLDHANIAQIFDLGSIGGQFYIVMEYIEGVDVQQVLEENRRRREFMPIPAALHIMSETLGALHYAHNQVGPDGQPLSIVHRDVSPQNIMVGYDGTIRLVDFGIAKARQRAQTTQAGVIKGKFYYMAPEQAHGNFVDARTDVFSAGMVLYEMITARSPYEDISDAELLKAVRLVNIPPPSAFRPDLDPELESVIMAAIQRDPNRRYPDAREFRYAIDHYAQRMYPPVNHREQMAHFVSNLFGRPMSNGPAHMSREEFRATEESLIFDRPDMSVIQQFRDHRDHAQRHRDDPPEDATSVWMHDEIGGPHSSSAQPDSSTRADLPSHRLPPSPHSASGAASRGVQPRLRSGGSAGAPTAERTGIARMLKGPKLLVAIGGLAIILVVLLLILTLGTRSSDRVATAEFPEVEDTTERPDTVDLAMTSTPINAQVFIDGELKGSTPVSVTVDTGKDYKVEIRRPGYEPWVQTVRVGSAQAEPIEAELSEAQGLMKVSSFPSEAVVLIDGDEIGKTPLTHGPLEDGKSYVVVASYEDKEEKRDVTWKRKDGAVVDLMFEFEEAPEIIPPVLAVEEAKPAPRRTVRKKRPTRRTQPKPRAEPEPKSTADDSLSVWDDSDSSSSGDSKDSASSSDSFSVWGDDSKPAKKKKAKPKVEEEEGLKVW